MAPSEESQVEDLLVDSAPDMPVGESGRSTATEVSGIKKRPEIEPKSLGNSCPNTLKTNVLDVQLFGNPDMFKLLSKASSKKEGWMKSTKAHEIENVGCLIQVTTQQRNSDGSYAVAEAVCFVPNVYIHEESKEDRKLKVRNK